FLAFLEHAPATHQGKFGIGVTLLLGVKVTVNVSERFEWRLWSHRGEGTCSNMLNPHHVGHELLEFGTLLIGDQFRARGVPIDIGKSPLLVFDCLEHVTVCESHFPCSSTRLNRSMRPCAPRGPACE